MSEIIYLDKVNEVYLSLDLTKSQAMELKEFLAFYASNYKYHPQFKAGFWDGRIFLFNTKEKLLPIGLLPKFIQFCAEYQYEYEFNFDIHEELSSTVTREFFDEFMDILFPPDGTIQPRYYQTEAIWKAISLKRGILQLATGAGKSLTQYSIIRYLIASNKKVLMIVPSVSLVEQMFSDFKEYGFDDAESNCNLIYAGKKYDKDKDITISTWQSLFTKGQSFFKDFDALIIDETHLAAGQSISSIAKMCVNAEYRIGLTGTMPKDEASANTIVAFLGPVAYQLGAKTLIEEGVLSKIKIKNLVLDYPEHMRVARLDYQSEQKAIIDYAERTPKVLDEILSNTPDGQNSLILVQRIEHLKAVRNYIVDNYQKYKVYQIFGDTPAKEREAIRKAADEEDNVIIVASYQTMSTGVSIRRLHNVIFFASYKSEVKVLQSIGRGLRKHSEKDGMILWDVIDDMTFTEKRKIHNFTYNHWLKYRLEYYKEQGFEYETYSINI